MANLKISSITFIILLGLEINLTAQNEEDALRYSQLIPVGSARFNSMAGAFGALGGDLSCASFNPAGIGVFRSSQFTISPVLSMYNGEADYYGHKSSTSKNNYGLSNIGFVVAAPKSNGSFINFAFTYNQLANFNRNTVVNGHNPNSSFIDSHTAQLDNVYRRYGYISENMIGFGDDKISPADYLIYQTDAVFLNNDSTHLINDYQNIGSYGSNQKDVIQSKGYAGEYNFSIGSNVNDHFYIGGSLGILHIKYEQQRTYTEIPEVENIELIDFQYSDQFKTYGNGFNLKIGAIYRANDFLRLGMALHTPTVFSLHDNYSSGASASIRYFDQQTNSSYVDKNEVYTDNSIYDYELSTPFKAILSSAFIFQKFGSLSVDYEYADYRLSSLSADDDAFEDVNNTINDIYRATSNVRVGGEFRLGMASFRGGFAFYGSPYASGQVNNSANYLIYSGGIGLKAKDAYIDFGFSHSVFNEKHFLYSDEDSRSNLTNTRNTIVTTIGFKF